MSEVIDSVCTNCGATETENHLGLPEGWVEVRVKSTQGIHLDSIICGDCNTALKQALSDRRAEATADSLQDKADAAAAAGEDTMKVTQKGTGKEALVSVSEIQEVKGEPKVANPKDTPAADSKPVSARRSAANAKPVAEASGTTGPNATGK